jgi:hypothetical protein
MNYLENEVILQKKYKFNIQANECNKLKTIILSKVVAVCLLLSFLTGNALAQPIEIGVKKGDFFIYNYSLSWTSTDPDAQIPVGLKDPLEIKSLKLSILDVSESKINIETRIYYKNNTETKSNGFVNLNEQEVAVPYGYLIIRANANPNERIYPSGNDGTINDTIKKTFSIGEITAIHYMNLYDSNDRYEKNEVYFDKITGVAVEYHLESRDTSDTYTTTLRETIILQSSNILGNNGLPLYIIFAIIIVILACILILTRITRKNKEF